MNEIVENIVSLFSYHLLFFKLSDLDFSHSLQKYTPKYITDMCLLFTLGGALQGSRCLR